MFGRFTSMLQQAVDVIAPASPVGQDFVTHWKCVTHYFIDNKEHNLAVEQTELPFHLESMQEILQDEEEGMEETGRTGPCIEYMLQHKILDTLYTLARTDVPPGMKQVILQFFTKLISRTRQPLLPHVNVHRPVHRLVRLCGEVKAAPSEAEEIQFLCVICSQLKIHQYLVNFFIEGISAGNESVAQNTNKDEKKKLDSLDFPMIASLLNLMHSPDARIGVKACEGLLLCASLTEDSSATAITKHTAFCTEMVTQLVNLYAALPKEMDPADIDSIEAKWGLDILSTSEDVSNFAGKRPLISFFSWLDYLDQLTQISHPVVSKALARTIRELFLESHIQPALMQASEAKAVTTTAHFMKCLKQISSEILLAEFVGFIVGDDKIVVSDREERPVVCDRLISRCDHLYEELSVTTLRLFEHLLRKPNERIIHNLVLRSLLGRGYYDAEVERQDECTLESDARIDLEAGSAASKTINKEKSNESDSGFDAEIPSVTTNEGDNVTGTCDDGNELTTDGSDKDNENIDSTKTTSSDSVVSEEELVPCNQTAEIHNELDSISPPSTPQSPDRSVSAHTIVNSFLHMIPDEAKSSYYMADSGYDTYLRDAHRMFSDASHMCQSWGWPHEPVVDADYASTGEEFFEGDFMKALLDKLSHLLNQTYNTNLQVTSLVSYLALLPHPNLNEFLLNPMLPLKPGVRSLTTVIKKLAHDIVVRQKKTPGFKKQLLAVRKELMGMDNNIRRSKGSSQCSGIDDRSFLEGVIILEEFCKELAAIAFVKHHAISI